MPIITANNPAEFFRIPSANPVHNRLLFGIISSKFRQCPHFTLGQKMLVLTRLAGESIVIGNKLKVTVHSVDPTHARLQVTKMEWPVTTPADILSDSSLAVDDEISVLPNVTCKITKIQENKVRLGIIAPKTIDIARYEVYDALRDKSPRPD